MVPIFLGNPVEFTDFKHFKYFPSQVYKVALNTPDVIIIEVNQINN